MTDILLATYNGSKYLEEQLISLFLQTDQAFDIIARDDGSTDGTQDILKKYAERYNKRFRIIEGEPTGSAKNNFFELLSRSTADYTMFCDQDDMWSKQKVERSIGCLRDGEQEYGKKTPLLVHTDLAVANGEMKVLNRSLMRMQKLNPGYHTLNRLLAQNNVTGCTMAINRALRELIVPSEAALMHDWWMALTAAAFGQVLYYPGATVVYRQHGENQVGAKDVSSGEYIGEKLKDKAGIRSSIKDTYAQAAAFYEAYKGRLNEENKTMLQSYVAIGSLGMAKRFFALSRGGFFKSGMYRKAAQIIYG